MSERVVAQLWVGGNVPKSLLPELAKALRKDEASDDIGGALVRDDLKYETSDDLNHDECLLGYTDPDGLLYFQCEAAPNGEFEHTESFCIQHGISFDRHHESGIEFDGEDARFRPGMNSPAVQYTDNTGNEVVCGALVRQALEQLDRTDVSEITRISEARSILREACSEIPPKLEAFEVG